jgi:3D (Asp-Asp-Asp) domain-containing protein
VKSNHLVVLGNFFLLIILSVALIFFGSYFTREKEIHKKYTDEISSLQQQLYINQQKLITLTAEKDNLIEEKQELIIKNDGLKSESDNLKLENKRISVESVKTSEENQKLTTFLEQLTNQQNALIETASWAAQNGLLKTSEIGITPIFRFSSDSVDKNVQQQTLIDLSNGSYQTKQEIINFSLKDMNSWQKCEEKWSFSGYNATVAQCDSTPSITASGKIVTPGFTIAIDHKYWEYGTIFYIEGLGFAVAADCGGGVKGQNRGDFLVASLEFARQVTEKRQVWIVYEPPKK